jgi:hypothetical protein
MAYPAALTCSYEMKNQNPELFMTALRVLSKSIHAEAITPQELKLLWRNAREEEAGLPLEELCCCLVRRTAAHQNRTSASSDRW